MLNVKSGCNVLLFLFIINGCCYTQNTPLSTEDYYKSALTLAVASDKEKLLNEINTALIKDSANIKYLMLRAVLYGEMDQYKNSIADFKKLLEYDKKGALIYYQHINRSFIFSGNEDSAAIYANKALMNGLSKESLLLSDVYSYIHIKKIDRAIPVINTLISWTQNKELRLEYLKLREYLYRKDHNFRAALEDNFTILNLVKDNKADSDIFNYNIALCYSGLNITDSARTYWVKVRNDNIKQYNILDKTVPVDVDREELSRSLDSLDNIKDSIRSKSRDRISFLTFIPESNILSAVCDQDSFCTIKFWSSEDSRLVRAISFPKNISVSLFSIDHDGANFVVCTNQNFTNDYIKCYSLKENRWLWEKKLYNDKILCSNIAYTQDNKKIIVITYTRILTLDAETGELLSDKGDFSKDFPRYVSAPIRKYLSEDGKYLIIWQVEEFEEGGRWLIESLRWLLGKKNTSRKMKFWDVTNNELLCEIDRPEGLTFLTDAAFTSDSRNLLLGSFNNYLRQYSFSDYRLLRELKLNLTESEWAFIKRFNKDPNTWEDNITSIKISPDNSVFATIKIVSLDVWDFKTGILKKNFGDPNLSPNSQRRKKPLAFSSDGKYFSFEMNGKLFLYDTNKWEKKWEVLTQN